MDQLCCALSTIHWSKNVIHLRLLWKSNIRLYYSLALPLNHRSGIQNKNIVSSIDIQDHGWVALKLMCIFLGLISFYSYGSWFSFRYKNTVIDVQPFSFSSAPPPPPPRLLRTWWCPSYLPTLRVSWGLCMCRLLSMTVIMAGTGIVTLMELDTIGPIAMAQL